MNTFDTPEFIRQNRAYFAAHPEISPDTHVIMYELAENREDLPVIIGHRRMEARDLYEPCKECGI